jgi:hypothetical protein
MYLTRLDDRLTSDAATVDAAVVMVIVQLRLVQTSAGADKVRIVSRRTDAHRLGGTSVEVAHLVREALQLMCRLVLVIGSEDLVEQDRVVCRTGGAC